LDLRLAHPKTFAKIANGSTNSLGVFLGQEIERFNRLIKEIKMSLETLQKAIKGLTVMSGEFEKMYECFIFNMVPPMWQKVAYPCLKPLSSWFPDMLARVDFMRGWLMQGPPKSFWISGFFFPQGFMTGTLQVFSRNTRTAIDALRFRNKVYDMNEEDVSEYPDIGVYIHGLFLQGGGWNDGMLTESNPRELFVQLPVVWIEPTCDDHSEEENKMYQIPVYKTSLRRGQLSTTGHSTNFVLFLRVPCAVDADHWTRRGCALLTQLDQ